MKKLLIFIGFILASVSTLCAQDDPKPIAPGLQKLELGMRFMPTISAFDLTTSSGGTVKGEATLGYGLGGMLAYNFTSHMGIQGEVIYSSLSQKYQDQEIDRKINVRYLNIPVLFSLNSDKSSPVNVNLVGGPQLGLNLGSNVSTSGGSASDTFTAVLVTKRSDFGFAYGGGLEFMLNPEKSLRFDLGLRGVYGFLNISNTSETQSSNDVYILERANVRTLSGYFGLTLLF